MGGGHGKMGDKKNYADLELNDLETYHGVSVFNKLN